METTRQGSPGTEPGADLFENFAAVVGGHQGGQVEAALRSQQVKDRLRLFAGSHDAKHLLAAVQPGGEFAVGKLPQVLKGYAPKYGRIDRRCDFTIPRVVQRLQTEEPARAE